MADFDWAWPKQIDRDAVEAALRLDFLEKAHNVVLVAIASISTCAVSASDAMSASRGPTRGLPLSVSTDPITRSSGPRNSVPQSAKN